MTLARDWIRVRLSSSFTNGRHLSGLPLLFYNAHILWSCRALEMELEETTPWGYARLLLGLTMVGVATELYVTHYLLQVLEYRNHATSTPIMIAMTSRNRRRRRRRRSRQQSTILAQHHDQVLTHRTMGSLTLTTCALLLVFRYRFPHAALQVLPLLSSTRIPLLDDPGFSYLLSTSLLAVLSFGTHPVTAILCGTFSGWLWGVGITSFICQEGYWASGMLAMYGVMCLLSLKVSGSRWIPCIDSVGWDSRGNIILEEPAVPLEFRNPEHDGHGGLDDESDEDDDESTIHSLEDQDATTAHEDDLELGLLTGRRTHSDDSLHHWLPVMGDMDDDDNDNGDDNDNDNDNDERRPMLPASTTTMRSRRNTSRVDFQ